MKNIVCQLYSCKIDFNVKYIWGKDVFNEITCKKVFIISNIKYGIRHSKPFNNCHVSCMSNHNSYKPLNRFATNFDWGISNGTKWILKLG